MATLRITCGATPGPYLRAAKVLQASCHDWGLACDLAEWPDAGSWLANVQQKARHCEAVAGGGLPFAWLDADALLVDRPTVLAELRPEIADVAVHYLGVRRELLSGTVWFSGSPRCLDLLAEWVRLLAACPTVLPNGQPAWDQRALDLAIAVVGARVHELPPEYCWVPGISARHYGPRRPVVVHTRAAFRELATA